MNKKNYIFIAMLVGSSAFANAQQAKTVSQRQLADTLSLGYQIKTSTQTSTYSISGVNSDAFDKSPAMDVSKALYGKIAGLNVYQGSGASSDNISSLTVHGRSPLVLVDGFPRDITDITSMEIESCYLLKDAAATALYGMRGGNGVLIITTKRGANAKLNVKIDYTFGLNTQYRSPEFADAYTYANAMNSALLGDGLNARYNPNELETFRSGTDPYNYPNVNWWDKTLNDTGYTNNLKMSFNGGNEKFRYFTVVNYYRDRSMLKENQNDNRYSTKPTDTRLSLRTNLDVQITESTLLKAGVSGRLLETNGTRYGRNTIFSPIYNTPAAAFPVRYENGIYGGSTTYPDNPVGMLKDYGHSRNVIGTLLADLSIQQDLDMLTKGLSAEVSISFDNSGGLQENSIKEFRYMNTYPKFTDDGTFITTPTIYGKDSETLDHKQPFAGMLMRSDFYAKVAYDRLFGKHQVNGVVLFDMQSVTRNGRNNSQKNLSFLANATYTYDGRYSVNAVINRSGSAYLPDGDKFRTYPAVSAAWIISNEGFMKNVSAINLLKVRASYGLSGWDGSLSHELWRQAYGGSNTSYNFGTTAAPVYGNSEGSLPIVGLTAERSEKLMVGIDLAAFANRLYMSVDAFSEKRSDVLVQGSNSVSGIVGIGIGDLCEGVYKYKGLDATISWNDKIGDFGYGIGTSMSYLDTEVVNSNQAFQQYDYLYQTGNRLGQMYGLEAIGFFNSQVEINNSPSQTFSTVAPGDVKYKDQNGDNRIDENDVVKMNGSSIPRFYFGFDVNLSYKNFEISADFQGLTGKTINLLNSPLYKPLVSNGNISTTFLDREKSWSPEDHANATMPRLTTQDNKNNYRASSLWYRDGSFIKLRNLMVAYTFPKAQTRFADVKVFVQGTNLFSLDNIHFTDPEQLGINYPSARSYWAGIKLNF